MKRHEVVLVVFAIVLLIGARELSSDATPPVFSSTGGEFPWSTLLWQFRHALAAPLAVVGLATAVGVLFLRAALWRKIPVSTPQQAQPEVRQLD
ncbi:MAG: hypothetical protein ABI400_08405 [Lacisediminihabitans sp.]